MLSGFLNDFKGKKRIAFLIMRTFSLNLFKYRQAFFLLMSLIVLSFPIVGWGYEVNKNAVVLLAAKNAEGQVVTTGTGFIIQPEGIVVSNYHNLLDAASMEAYFRDGTHVPIEIIRGLDRTKDFCILQLKKGFYSTLELGNSDDIKDFHYTSALGYPIQTVRMNAVSAKNNLLQTFGFTLGIHPQAFPEFNFIYTTTPLSSGFSGGPLVNEKNQVVGISTVEGRAINLALPINYIKPKLKENLNLTFQQLQEQDKTSKEAMYYRGSFALFDEGNPNKAINLLKNFLTQKPDFPLAHYDLAIAYRNMGQVDNAIKEYEKALKLNPSFPEALSNLGGQYFRQGTLDKAVTHFKQAVAIYPNFIQALSNLGAVLNKQNKANEALPYLQKAIDLDPEFAIAYFNLGNTYFALHKINKAENTYSKAVELGLDFLSLHWKLYEIYEKQGRPAEAVQELKVILQLDPENPEAKKKLESLNSSH